MIQNYIEIVFAFILKDTTGQSMMSQEKLHYDVTIITSFVEFTGEKRRTKVYFTTKVEEMAFRYIFSFVNFCEKVKIFKIFSLVISL